MCQNIDIYILFVFVGTPNCTQTAILFDLFLEMNDLTKGGASIIQSFLVCSIGWYLNSSKKLLIALKNQQLYDFLKPLQVKPTALAILFYSFGTRSIPLTRPGKVISPSASNTSIKHVSNCRCHMATAWLTFWRWNDKFTVQITMLVEFLRVEMEANVKIWRWCSPTILVDVYRFS